MKLLFTSDLHGDKSAYRKYIQTLQDGGYDFGVLGGDLLLNFSSEEYLELMGKDYDQEQLYSSEEEKAMLLKGLRTRKNEIESVLHSNVPIYFVLGNDDGVAGGGTKWDTSSNLININERSVRVGKYNIVGYQYSSPFVGGIYEKDEKEQEQDLARIRKLISEDTILVTHSPPFGVLDNGLGSKAIKKLVEETKPRYHLFGHIHEAFGFAGNSINGSYALSKKFVSIDLDAGRVSLISTNTIIDRMRDELNDR